MEHTLLVAAHAGSGVLAFVAGWRCSPSRPRTSAAVLVGRVGEHGVDPDRGRRLDWPGLQPAQRECSPHSPRSPSCSSPGGARPAGGPRAPGRVAARLLPHAGFVVVSLLDAFCVVSAVDLHLPPVVVAVVAVLAAAPACCSSARGATRAGAMSG